MCRIQSVLHLLNVFVEWYMSSLHYHISDIFSPPEKMAVLLTQYILIYIHVHTNGPSPDVSLPSDLSLFFSTEKYLIVYST